MKAAARSKIGTFDGDDEVYLLRKGLTASDN